MTALDAPSGVMARVDKRPVWWLFVGYVVVVTAALLGALAYVLVSYVPRERDRTIAAWQGRLTAMGDDRQSAIEHWVDEGLADARAVAAYPAVRRLTSAAAALGSGSDPGPAAGEHLGEVFASLPTNAEQRAIVVLGRGGEVLASSPERWMPGGDLIELDRRVMRSGSPEGRIVPLRDGSIGVVFAAPVEAPGDGAAGAVLMAVDASKWLFPFLAHEPTGSATAETVLMRREGDRAVFLSPLRHARAGPLAFSRPLATTGFAAAQALAGHAVFGEFTDYRDVRVFAATRSIAGTDWGLVAKVDRAEVLAPFHRDVRTGGLLVGSAYLAMLALGFGVWRGTRAAHYKALAASEERFALLRDHAGDAIFFVRPGGRLIDANRRFEELYGYSRAELLGLTIRDLRGVGARDGSAAATSTVLETGALEVETVHRRKDGSEFPVSVSARAATLGGAPVIISLVRDVSEQKDAAARIVFLNRLYRTVSAINQLIVREKGRDRLLAEACRIAVEQGGFRMVWVGFADFATGRVQPAAASGVDDGYLEQVEIRCDDSPAGRGPTGTAIRENRTVVITDTEIDESYEPWRGNARQRGYRSSMAAPLRVNGQAIGSLNVYAQEAGVLADEVVALVEELADDIGYALEAMHHEAALRESEERYRLLAENATDLIYLWRLGPEPGFEYVSPAALALTGYDALEFVADPGLYPRVVSAGDRTVLERVLAGDFDPTEALSVRIVRRDGQVAWTAQRHALVRGVDGRPVAVEGIVRDVTAQHHAEEQLLQAQKMEGVGRLAAGVAHDFNNLLQALMGVAQLLRLGGNRPETIGEVVGELESHVKRGAQLTRQLLLFSRRETPKREKLDLNEALQYSADMLRRLLRENIAFSLERAETPLPVDADGGQLEQVLVNLVVNAADAMPQGGRLEIRSGREGQDWVWFAVSDSGSGIPEAARSKIFEPFYTTKGRGKGTGLGLSVVHGIVTQHGGRIEVESEVGRGSTFRVLLPHRGSGTLRAVIGADAAEMATRASGERILLVEDDAAVRELLCRFLTSLGYAVTAAGCGEDAGSLPADRPFDLLVTDAVLPGASGLDVARSLRQRWPELRVILLSGYAPDSTLDADIAAERIAFLQKPVELDTFGRAVRAALA